MREAHATAEKILRAIVNAYRSAAVDLPERQYTTAGDVVFDTEQGQLTVTFVNLYLHDASITSQLVEPVQCRRFNAALYEVMLLRCAPALEGPIENPKIPTAEALAVYGERAMDDAQMIEDAIAEAWALGDFGEGPMLAFETVEAVGPVGGVGGVALRVRIGLE